MGRFLGFFQTSSPKGGLMTFSQLRNFCTIAEYMSFSKAADSLYISQSAMSKSIRALEGELHCDLFVRRGKKLLLSSYGEVLLPYAREMVSHFDTMCTEARQALGQSSQELFMSVSHRKPAISFFIKWSSVSGKGIRKSAW